MYIYLWVDVYLKFLILLEHLDTERRVLPEMTEIKDLFFEGSFLLLIDDSSNEW